MIKLKILIIIIFIGHQCLPHNLITVKKINIEGNKKTKNEIILRELEFNNLDRIKETNIPSLIKRSESNLLNTSLFNFVNIDYLVIDDSVSFNVSVTERWYYWVYPILEQADRNLSSFLHYKNYNKYNYGLAFDKQNFLGLNQLLKFKLRLGYREHYSFYYVAPEIDADRKHGFWLGTDYFRQKQVLSKTVKNKPVYYSSETDYIFNNHRVEAGYSFRPDLYYDYKFRLVYQSYNYDDSLSLINSAWTSNNIQTKHLNPEIKYEFDNRDNINYPLKGSRLVGNLRFPDFLNLHDSGFFIADVKAEINYFAINDLIYGRSNFTAFNIFYNHSETYVPYYIRSKYNNKHIIRGYEYYYIYSPYFFSFQQTFSFVLSDYREHNISFIKNEKFGKFFTRVYLNMFFDLAYSGLYPDLPNNSIMNGFLLHSCGAGIVFETYYDRVLELRVAYNGFHQNFGIFVDYKKTILKAF